MRKIAVIIALALLLTGCGDSIEIKDRIIVQMLGFDYYDGNYTVTLQYFFQQNSDGQANLGTADSNARTVSGKGKTISAAVRQIASEHGKQIFYGQNNVIIFGSTIDSSRFESVIDYLVHDYKGRGGNLVFAAEGDAMTLLEVEINGSLVPAETVENTSKSSKELGICPIVRFIDLQNSVYGRSEVACLPIIRINTISGAKSELKPESIYINGMRIYRGFNYARELDSDGCKALLVLQDEYKRGLITCELDNYGEVSIRLESCECSCRAALDPISVNVKIRASGIISEIERPGGDLSKEDIKSLQQQAESKIELIMRKFFADTLGDGAIDLIGLNNQLYKLSPAQYKNGAGQKLSDAEIRCDVSVAVAGTELRGK